MNPNGTEIIPNNVANSSGEPSRRLTIFAVVAVIAVGLGIIILSVAQAAHRATYSATLSIKVAPSDSTLTVNSQSGKVGSIRVKPGSYTVKASRKGFDSQSKSVSIKKGATGSVTLVLVPNSAATANWYQLHPKDEATSEGLSSQEFDTNTALELKNNPLIALLPYVAAGNEFYIDYSNTPDDLTHPTIYITAGDDQSKADALAWIRSQGYDPGKMKIQYLTPDTPNVSSNNTQY